MLVFRGILVLVGSAVLLQLSDLFLNLPHGLVHGFSYHSQGGLHGLLGNRWQLLEQLLSNAWLKEGSKSDRIDARKLAELLRVDLLRSVYHGERRASVP